jgi:hypothetical protein
MFGHGRSEKIKDALAMQLAQDERFRERLFSEHTSKAGRRASRNLRPVGRAHSIGTRPDAAA